MKNLQDLIDILAQPNMGDEGRKAKLIAIKAWQIKFAKDLEEILDAENENWKTAKAAKNEVAMAHATGRIQLISAIFKLSKIVGSDKLTESKEK